LQLFCLDNPGRFQQMKSTSDREDPQNRINSRR
jgi:hypothetical protein